MPCGYACLFICTVYGSLAHSFAGEVGIVCLWVKDKFEAVVTNGDGAVQLFEGLEYLARLLFLVIGGVWLMVALWL